MEIKTEKQLDKVLNGTISVPIYWQYKEAREDGVEIDEESIIEEFEFKLKEIINAVENY